MQKNKKCKGTGKATGFGCGNSKQIHRYGLCLPCFKDWLFNSENGKNLLNSVGKSAKNKTEKEERAKLRQQKEQIKSKSFFEKQLQFEINAIVRLIDTDNGCISCEHGWKTPWTRQRHAGHFYSVGAYPNLRYNLFNIWVQCSICNNYLSGNERAYERGILNNYGQAMLDAIKELPSKYGAIKLYIDELKEKIEIARTIHKNIKNGFDYTREQINEELGIYDKIHNL